MTLGILLLLGITSRAEAKIDIHVSGDSRAEVKIENVINTTGSSSSTIDVHVKNSGASTHGIIKVDERNKQEKMENQEARKQTNFKTRVKANAAHLFEHYKNRIEILKKIAARLDSRIVKLEARGFSLVRSKQLLAEANVKIDAAETDRLQAQAEIEAALQGTVSTTTASTTRARLSKTEGMIRLAHKALVSAISSAGISISATSTASTTITH